MRIRNAWRTTVSWSRALLRAIAGEIGRDELFLASGLGLVGYGLALTPWPPAAYIVPGGVLVWMALPPRKPFVVTPGVKQDERRN